MNGEEEKASEVIESPPLGTDEHPPLQEPSLEKPAVDEPEDEGQFVAASAAVGNEPGVSSDNVEKLGGGGEENGQAAAGSSSLAERTGKVVGSGEIPVFEGCSMSDGEGKVEGKSSGVDEVNESTGQADSSAGSENGDREAVAEEFQKFPAPAADEPLELVSGEMAGEEEKKAGDDEAENLQKTLHDNDTEGGNVGDGEDQARVKIEDSIEEEAVNGNQTFSPVNKKEGELTGDGDAQAVVKDVGEPKGKGEATDLERMIVKENPEQMDDCQQGDDSSSTVVAKELLKDAETETETDEIRKLEVQHKKEVGTDLESGMLAAEEEEVDAIEVTVPVVKDETEVAAEEEVDLQGKEQEVEGVQERNSVLANEVKAMKETDEVAEQLRVKDTEEDMIMEAGEERMVDAEDTEMEAGADEEVEAEDTFMDAGEDEDEEVDADETEVEAGEDQEVDAGDTEMEAGEGMRLDEVDAQKTEASSGNPKRGLKSKSQAKVAPRKTIGEDVCFICLDGGDLVLCDRRGCPKAYHPSCVDRDEAFFQSKGRWNCGWHLCSKCGKNTHYMCCTCAFSLCKGCIKDTAIYLLRGNKGLCETCMKSVKEIENNEEGNAEKDQEMFNDRSSWEYLFKDYWTEQKAKLSLTSEEIRQARNPWRGSDVDVLVACTEGANGSESSLGNVEATIFKTKKSKKHTRSISKEVDGDIEGSPAKRETTGVKRKGRGKLKHQLKDANSDLDNSSEDQDGSASKRRKTKKPYKAHAKEASSVGQHDNNEWASQELLEFVMHMKNGDRSVLSQFDVQELLLEYIKRNKLRDPRRRSQILCDAMLQRIFGKPRVGHFEMLKLLESHFLLKEDADENQGSVVDTEASQLDADETSVETGRNRLKKVRKKSNERGLQSNLDDYAAIDMHNISLIFLRRNLMESLMEDMESFPQKVVGSFVRIRISGSNQKQDIYRLVQVLGTTKAAEPYRVGKKTVDVMLEILNLNKTEVILIDKISNQDFTEDECKRLRQSIKCGFISRLTVGDLLEKAKEFQTVRVNDWLETETTRLNHLRDRASDMGRKKELRECVEKLQLLSTPEERQRRLDEIPEVHADPNMDPGYESEDDNDTDDRREDINLTPRGSQFSRRSRDSFSFSSRKGDSASTDEGSSIVKPTGRKWDLSRSSSGKGFSSRNIDSTMAGETLNGSPWNPQVDKVSPYSSSSEKPRITSDSLAGRQLHYSDERTNLSHVAQENQRSFSVPVAHNDVKINEAEKQWHYRDPAGKVQGPFSIVQLRKWDNTARYFPANLRIWRTGQSEDDSILLTEALAGRFQKESSRAPIVAGKPYEAALQQQGYRSLSVVKQNVIVNNIASSDRLSPVVGRPQTDINSSRSWVGAASSSVNLSNASMYESSALSSTPSTNTSITGKVGRVRSESRWSGQPIPDQSPSSAVGSSLRQGAHDSLPSPTPESNRVSKFSSLPQGVARSYSMQQSPEVAAPNQVREDERFGSSAHAHQLSSQLTATNLPMSQAPTMHHQVQPAANSVSVVTSNTAQGFSNNNVIQSPLSVQGWGSSGNYVAKPEIANQNPNNMNPIQAQVQMQQQQPQQPGYGQWVNNVVNNPAAPQQVPYGNYVAAVTAQNQWRPPQQVASTAHQPNMQWGANMGVAVPENPSAAPTSMVQGNSNMGWATQSQPAQFGAQVQPSNPAQTPSTMQPINSNMAWPVAGNMNQGWAANPAGNMNQGSVNSGWNRQQQQQQQQQLPPRQQYGGQRAMGPSGSYIPKSQKACPYLMQGYCKKGSACDFKHG